MIKKAVFSDLKELNNYIVNNSILKSNIISINSFFDKRNTDWGVILIQMFYFEPSILGDDQ